MGWGCLWLRGCHWADQGWQATGWCPSPSRCRRHPMHSRLAERWMRCYGSSGAARLL